MRRRGTRPRVNIENIAGGLSDDTLVGNAGANTIDGDRGEGIIDGRAGSDRLIGGFGDDGTNGRSDVFRVWIAGVEQTTDGRLSKGDAKVTS